MARGVIMNKDIGSSPLPDGTVYSERKKFCPFSAHTIEDYKSILSEAKIARLCRAAQRLAGLKLLELNATARGGGVAELLYSSIPFLNTLGIKAEWKIIYGSKEYYECTKKLHNLLQGQTGSFSAEMKKTYCTILERSANDNLIDFKPDVVIAHDPQLLGLIDYLKKPGEIWFWRCHIDVEEAALRARPDVWDFITSWSGGYDAAIFSAVYHIISEWPVPKFTIPPFIDPFSEKNRELSHEEIDKVLAKYHIDPSVPTIVQIGRFDPWKGIDRTMATYRQVRKVQECQLVLAGGLAADDPEGERILAQICEETKKDDRIHVLNLSLENRLENYREVNALQRAASIIMQPSTREGFGLVITEALWKGKPVITSPVGGIPLQVSGGNTGFFYQAPHKTAQKIIYLLRNQKAAALIGERGKKYVEQHFLLPDRVADHLIAIDMMMNETNNRRIHSDSIISFYPWFKPVKRGSRFTRSTQGT